MSDIEDSIGKLLNLVEQEINSGNEYSAIENLKSSGLEHDKACVFVEIIMLRKLNYFSFFSGIKRFITRRDNQSVKGVFELLSSNLISTGHYDSIEAITNKIIETEKSFEKVQLQFNYRDDLYYYASKSKRKVIILMNLHFSGFSKHLQQIIVNVIGKAKIVKNIDKRAKYVFQKVSDIM